MESLLKRATDSPLGKSALGVVVLLLLGLIYVQQRTAYNSRSDTESKLFQLFADHQKDMKDTSTRQWQNQTKIADGLNAVVVQLARIESLMRIPIDQRPTVSAETPKPITLKPPM